MILLEAKVQGWRALAINRNGGEHLLYVSSSADQVKKNYVATFYELLTQDEQNDIRRIVLERWYGVADSGKWLKQDFLKLPTSTTMPIQSFVG